MAASVLADDHRRPSAVLVTTNDRQAGRIISMSWARRVTREECIITDGTSSLTFPRAVRTRPGEVVRVRLKKDEIPTEFAVESWRSVRANGTPRGEPKPIPALLSPRRRDGRIVRWVLRFRLRDGYGHSYLHVTAHWKDETGCHPPPDLGSQYASWSFHVRSPR